MLVLWVYLMKDVAASKSLINQSDQRHWRYIASTYGSTHEGLSWRVASVPGGSSHWLPYVRFDRTAQDMAYKVAPKGSPPRTVFGRNNPVGGFALWELNKGPYEHCGSWQSQIVSMRDHHLTFSSAKYSKSNIIQQIQVTCSPFRSRVQEHWERSRQRSVAFCCAPSALYKIALLPTWLLPRVIPSLIPATALTKTDLDPLLTANIYTFTHSIDSNSGCKDPKRFQTLRSQTIYISCTNITIIDLILVIDLSFQWIVQLFNFSYKHYKPLSIYQCVYKVLKNAN